METRAETQKRKGVPGRPFQKGCAPGPGRPKADSPEAKAKRAREAVQRRVVADLVAEMRQAADLAVDALLDIVADPAIKPSDRIAAAREVLARGFGTPVATTLTVAADMPFDDPAVDEALAALRRPAP